MQERLPVATSQEYGTSLQAVQQLMKKNQVRQHQKNCTEQKHELFLMAISSQSLQKELQGHRGRVEDVLERAGVIASIRSPEADSIRAGMEQLHQLWEVLWIETEHRQLRLDVMYQAQQYYFDAGEVEAWLSEQELHMMNEEKGKVGAGNTKQPYWGDRSWVKYCLNKTVSNEQ